MIKKTLYPKTKRLESKKEVVTITEKIDGSNLSFFKLDGELYIAQRNNIYTLTEAMGVDTIPKNVMYKHLYEFLSNYGAELKADLQEKAVVSGEWIAMGRIDYGDVPQRFLQFAKGNVDDEMNLTKLNYNHELFKWSFISQEVPVFIGKVPVVAITDEFPTKEELDELYESYSDGVIQDQGHPVEGFVVAVGNDSISKYVRFKDGALKEHFTWGGN